MNKYAWRTRDDRLIAIWDLPAGPERILMADAAIMHVMDSVETKWGDKCRQYAEPNGLPDGVLQAHIGRESNGYVRAYRKEPNGWTGVGLLQITHPNLKGKLTDEQLFDPDTNIRVGAKYLGQIWKTQGGDFPKASATFNAGSPRPSEKNPWNMVQADGHVTWEVQAYNYWLTKYAGVVVTPEELHDVAEHAYNLNFDLTVDIDELNEVTKDETT